MNGHVYTLSTAPEALSKWAYELAKAEPRLTRAAYAYGLLHQCVGQVGVDMDLNQLKAIADGLDDAVNNLKH